MQPAALSPDQPHRRFNSLSGEWILVSPHRTKRPWQGKQDPPNRETRPQHDPKCYLCAGNERAGGLRNPAYTSTFVFDNDFAAILPELLPADQNSAGAVQQHRDGFKLMSEAVVGTCRVICFSPRHDWTLPEMPLSAIEGVIDTWARESADFGRRFQWVQIFENKGEIMGCSNPHPHGQLWACSALPNEPAKEQVQQLAHWAAHKRPLLLDYLATELQAKERIVVANPHWVALVPYWATWPYETLLLPRRHVLRLPDLTTDERTALADILKRLLTRYDNLFEVSMPYSMGWHGAPWPAADAGAAAPDYQHWQLHAHFYPPLLRSASIRKFMVGFELLAEAQRDITPEQAAAKLAALSDVHYKVAAQGT